MILMHLHVLKEEGNRPLWSLPGDPVPLLLKPLKGIANSRCIGCRKCIKLGCPALAIKDGVAEINSQLCTGCGMCAQVCPRQAITLSEESKGDSRG